MTSEPLKTSVQIDPAIRAVEVKITARIEDEEKILQFLKNTGEEPKRRTVFFFDTPKLDLFDAGLVLRARKTKDDVDDTTVKLRPVDPARIPLDWMQTEGFEVEMDRVGAKEIISAKLSAEQDTGEIDEAVAGSRPLRKLFSTDQERLITEFGPADVGWDALTVMGPIDVRKWKVELEDFEHEIVAEAWKLPDGSDLVELSIKVEPGEASGAAAAFTSLLEDRGLDVDGDMQTKTKGALRFFTSGEGFD